MYDIRQDIELPYKNKIKPRPPDTPRLMSNKPNPDDVKQQPKQD